MLYDSYCGHYAFDKTQQSIHNGKNDPDVNSGLIITYQYLFINCNKCTRLRQNVNNSKNNKDGVRWRGGNEVYGNSLHFPLIFCKPKAALKNKVY